MFFFASFALMQNVEIWSETKMERSENKTKKKRKIAIIFASKRNKAKRKRKTPIIFASKRNEAKQKWKNTNIFASKRNGNKICSLRCEKSVFFACFRIWSERKMKLSENKVKKRLFRFALKRYKKTGRKTKKFWKRNKAKIRSINFAMVGSKKFKAKWSEIFFFTWACETHAKRISFRFVSLSSKKFFFAKPAHPNQTPGNKFRIGISANSKPN